MANIFKEYSEAIKVDSRMTPEERAQVARYREIIADLRTQGDDQGIMSDIRTLYGRIKKIENKYTTEDERKRAQQSSERSSMKRTKAGFEARKERGAGASAKYNEMSDEDKAREAIVSLRNTVQLYRSNHYPKDKMIEIKRKVAAAANDIVTTFGLERPYQIKSKFSLKEKAGYWGKINPPDKLKEIFKKYKLAETYI